MIVTSLIFDFPLYLHSRFYKRVESMIYTDEYDEQATKVMDYYLVTLDSYKLPTKK